MNFLQLCQDLVSELGLAGGSGPTTVVGQTGELRNVVRWIAQASLDIENQWVDWKFLHVEYLGIIPLNSRTPSAPTPAGIQMRKWDRDSFVLNYGTTQAKPLHYEEWATFRKVRQLGSAALSVDEPAIITVKPDGTLQTYPSANATYPLSGEGWRRPQVMALDTDTPLLPAEYHRLIMVTAAIKYANREDAPEIIMGSEAEYTSAMEKLERDQLPAFEAMGMSTQDVVLEGSIPGCD
jgi:hypothetical protein